LPQELSPFARSVPEVWELVPRESAVAPLVAAELLQAAAQVAQVVLLE